MKPKYNKRNKMFKKEIGLIVKIHSKLWEKASKRTKKQLIEASAQYKRAEAELDEAKRMYDLQLAKSDRAIKRLEKATNMLDKEADPVLKKELGDSHRKLAKILSDQVVIR